MRINVYSQELTDEVIKIKKVSNTDIPYRAVQFVLHSSPMLHHPPQDDDRSAVTFWLPQSSRGLQAFATALRKASEIVAQELAEAKWGEMSESEKFNATYDSNARARSQYDSE